MEGATGDGASPVVHEGSWWLLGLGLLSFALLCVLLAGMLTQVLLAGPVGAHRAARVERVGRPPVVRGPSVAGRRRLGVPLVGDYGVAGASSTVISVSRRRTAFVPRSRKLEFAEG